MFDFNLAAIAAGIPGLIVGLSFHELAHAAASTYFGDPTPRRQGRLTANPMAHLDPLGSIMLLLTMIGASPIGWAKPVMTNPTYWRGNKSTVHMLVSAAGPAANLIIAFLGIIAFAFLKDIPEAVDILGYLISINVSLAVFNLIPIPPLDGAAVLSGLLPGKRGAWIGQLEQYGSIILLILVISGVLSGPIRVVNGWIIGGMFGIVNLFL